MTPPQWTQQEIADLFRRAAELGAIVNNPDLNPQQRAEQARLWAAHVNQGEDANPDPTYDPTHDPHRDPTAGV
jgi:hypothetical protein